MAESAEQLCGKCPCTRFADYLLVAQDLVRAIGLTTEDEDYDSERVTATPRPADTPRLMLTRHGSRGQFETQPVMERGSFAAEDFVYDADAKDHNSSQMMLTSPNLGMRSNLWRHSPFPSSCSNFTRQSFLELVDPQKLRHSVSARTTEEVGDDDDDDLYEAETSRARTGSPPADTIEFPSVTIRPQGRSCYCRCHSRTVPYCLTDILHQGFTATVLSCRQNYSSTTFTEVGSLADQVDNVDFLRPIKGLDRNLARRTERAGRWMRQIVKCEDVVIKLIHKAKCDRNELERCFEEVEFLEQLRHPNVVRLLGRHDGRSQLWMFFERAQYSDLECSIAGREFNEEAARIIMRQILQALKHCHSQRIVHGDLKPKNILVYSKYGGLSSSSSSSSSTAATSDVQSVLDLENNSLARSLTADSMYNGDWTDVVLKLADFGLATLISNGKKSIKFERVIGSHGYFAPEILLRRDYDYKVDIWAAGIIAFKLLGGYEPWYPPSACIQEKLRFQDRTWDLVSENAKDFIRGLLEHSPTARFTAEEALSHSWMKLLSN